MKEITLSGRSWRFDETKPLGSPGGFGAVFLGVDENDAPVAVKRLHFDKQQHAARELEIADFLTGHDHPHIIPIYAAGKDVSSGQHFIVMAKANQSLQDLIESSAPIPEEETVEIVSAIASALVEIGEFVHRDLKPANVLFHNGIWKLADLGLARYVEAATSLNTMKDFLSAPYAAPEQWRGERATKKTDVYAVGCILYALLMGSPPFLGQTFADYSQQHQYAPPPPLKASPRLQRLALSCLAKSEKLRPSVESLRTQIERVRSVSILGAANPLINAAATLVENEVRREALELEEQKLKNDRIAAADEAVKQLVPMMDDLFNLIITEAPNAKLLALDEFPYGGTHPQRRVVRLGHGYLQFDIPYPFISPETQVGNWDVLVGGMIEVVSSWMSYDGSKSRSANLWFGKIGTDDSYRWWEVAYMHNRKKIKEDPSRAKSAPHEPFSLGDNGHSPAGFRYRGITFLNYGDYKLAYNPKLIDGEYFDDFCARWTNWLAKVALNQLARPKSLPEETIAPEFIAKAQS